MLQDVSHTGITVQNIDQSLAFYRDLLGLEIIFIILPDLSSLVDARLADYAVQRLGRAHS